MREIKYRLDLTHNFLKIDAGKEFYLRPNDDNTQKIFMLPQSYTINCRRLLLRETSLTPQWYLDLLYYVDESDTRGDNEIIEDVFKFSTFDVSMDSDNVSSSGQNVFVEGVNAGAPWFAGVFEKFDVVSEKIDELIRRTGAISGNLTGSQDSSIFHPNFNDVHQDCSAIISRLRYNDAVIEKNRFDFSRFPHKILFRTFVAQKIRISAAGQWHEILHSTSGGGEWYEYFFRDDILVSSQVLVVQGLQASAFNGFCSIVTNHVITDGFWRLLAFSKDGGSIGSGVSQFYDYDGTSISVNHFGELPPCVLFNGYNVDSTIVGF